MKIKFIITIFISILAMFDAQAFTKKADALKNKNIFGIVFENDSSIYISALAVTSISKQEYILGTLFVSEIVIDTAGNSQIRIYNSSPLDPSKIKKKAIKILPTAAQSATEIPSYAEKAKGMIEDKSGLNLSGVSTVYKEFPITTHAKTVEFAIAKPEMLEMLYELLIADFSATVISNTKEETSKNKNSKPIEAGRLGGSLYIQE